MSLVGRDSDCFTAFCSTAQLNSVNLKRSSSLYLEYTYIFTEELNIKKNLQAQINASTFALHMCQ